MEHDYVVFSYPELESIVPEKRPFANTVNAAVNILNEQGWAFMQCVSVGGPSEILCFFKRKEVA